MCGQFAVLGGFAAILAYIKYLGDDDLIITDDDFYILESDDRLILPNEHIKPMCYMPIVSANQNRLNVQVARWGLVPHWSKDESFAYKTINARFETLSEKPSYKYAYAKRRCLIPFTGFYERGSDRQLHYFQNQNDEIKCFAGLYEIWGEQNLVTFTIVTKPADERVKPVHERMPMIVDGSCALNWICESGMSKITNSN
jgi:putative SOS response-associated peptidase YedK